MTDLRLVVSNPVPVAPLVRDVGKRAIFNGLDITHTVHYAVPRGTQWPKNAGAWFGVYDHAAQAWVFELDKLSTSVAARVREVLVSAVPA